MALALARFLDTETNTKFLGFVAQANSLKEARYFFAESGSEFNINGRYKYLYLYPWYFNLNEIIKDKLKERANTLGYDWLKVEDEIDGFFYNKLHDGV